MKKVLALGTVMRFAVMHYSAYRGISIECEVTTFFAQLLERRRGRVVKLEENNVKVLQNFWVRFSVTPIHFKWFE